MIATVQLEWGVAAKVKALTAEQYAELREHLNMSEEISQENFIYYNTYVIYLETAGPWLTSHGIEFTIKKMKNVLSLPANVAVPAASIVHVHVPNIGLILIDDVTNLDDACTDHLQSYLDKGWRILAICPSNGQRRTDYILGRTKSESSR